MIFDLVSTPVLKLIIGHYEIMDLQYTLTICKIGYLRELVYHIINTQYMHINIYTHIHMHRYFSSHILLVMVHEYKNWLLKMFSWKVICFGYGHLCIHFQNFSALWSQKAMAYYYMPSRNNLKRAHRFAEFMNEKLKIIIKYCFFNLTREYF